MCVSIDEADRAIIPDLAQLWFLVLTEPRSMDPPLLDCCLMVAVGSILSCWYPIAERSLLGLTFAYPSTCICGEDRFLGTLLRLEIHIRHISGSHGYLFTAGWSIWIAKRRSSLTGSGTSGPATMPSDRYRSISFSDVPNSSSREIVCSPRTEGCPSRLPLSGNRTCGRRRQ